MLLFISYRKFLANSCTLHHLDVYLEKLFLHLFDKIISQNKVLKFEKVILVTRYEEAHRQVYVLDLVSKTGSLTAQRGVNGSE